MSVLGDLLPPPPGLMGLGEGLGIPSPQHCATHVVNKAAVCAHRRQLQWYRQAQDARSVSGQCSSSTISTSRTVSRTMGSQGNKCLKCWRWRMTSFSGVSQAGPPQSYRGPTGASVLTSCATSPLQLICRLTVRSSLSNCWIFDSQVVLAAAAYICIKLHSARYPDPAPFQLPDSPAASPLPH